MAEQDAQRRRALELEVERARYEARLAERRYETCDPDNRLVAAELEARWDAAMQRLRECEQRLVRPEKSPPEHPDQEVLLAPAGDLAGVWRRPSTDIKRKQRIARVLIEEISADVDEDRGEVVLLIHWRGGQHSELRVKKPRPGKHTKQTAPQSLEIIRQMAGRWSDEDIAATLNRMGLTTGQGRSWNALRVAPIRRTRGMAAYAPAYGDGSWLTMYEAARHTGATPQVIRRLALDVVPHATQVIRNAPWQIRTADLDSPAVQRALADAKRRATGPCRIPGDGAIPVIPGLSGNDAR